MKNTVFLIIMCVLLVAMAAITVICIRWRISKKVRLDPCVEKAVIFFRGVAGIKDKSLSARLWTEISAADGKLICRFTDPDNGEIAAAARKIHIYGDETSANNEHISEAVNISKFPDGTKISFDEGYCGYTLTFAAKMAFPGLARFYSKELILALAAAEIGVCPSANTERIIACIPDGNKI